MHRHATKSWQDPGGVHRHHATLGMHGEQAQQRCGRRVDPGQPARDPGAGLIEVGDLGPRQLLAHPIHEPAKPPGGLGQEPTKPPRRHVRADPIVQHLGGPLDRYVLPHPKVDPKRADPRAIARRRPRLLREHPGSDLPAGARSPLGPMLTHPQPHLGQIEHLPGLHPHDRRQRQIPTTATTPLGRVHHDLVRLGHLGQVRARRTGLLAGRPPTTTPLPPRRRRLAKPIRRRWPRRVGGVLAQTTLQLSHPRVERGDQAGLLGIGRHQPGVGLPQLLDHHRLDRDGGLQ